ncbi:MAG: ParB/RepB/Spo0J family partition protein [Chloroflexia bacterium]
MEERLIYLDPRQVQPDPKAVRHDPGDIAALAASIAAQGLLQPIGVIHMWGDTYRVVFGHRRLEAAKQLGLERIPCLLLETDPDELYVPQLVENLQRLDLNDLEKAEAMARLRQRMEREQPHLSAGELDELVGRQIGLSGRTVRRYLSLLELSPAVQELIRQGELTVTHAQHLLRIPNPVTREEVAREAAEAGLSAAQIAQLASFFAANPNLTLETALQALESGARPRREAPPEPVEGPPERLVRVPLEEGEERVWLEEEAEGLPPEEGAGDWARLRRFHSLDEILDEVGRISRSFHEGDIERWAGADAQAPVKLRLLARALRSTLEALERLFRQKGWSFE